MEANLNKFINFVKTRRRLIVIFIFILFCLALFYNLTKKESKGSKSTLPSTTSSPVEQGINKTGGKRQNPSIVYLFNRFDSKDGVTGYTWNGNKIVYSTNDGIFNLWKNEPVVNTPIDYINFNSRGQGVYLSKGVYFVFDSTNDSNIKLGPGFNNIQINNNGRLILYQGDGFINIMDILSGEIKTLKTSNTDVSSFGWTENGDSLYVYNRNTNNVFVYDLNMNRVRVVDLKVGSKFLSINPEAGRIITEVSDGIEIADLDTNTSTKIALDQGAKYYSYWTSPTEIILVETLERGGLGLFDDYIWRISTNGKKTFLANSFPITNKLNLNTKIIMNADRNTLIFSENKGKIWTLSLIPSYISTYSEGGVSFYNLPTNKED